MLWMNDDQPIQVNPKGLNVQDFVHEDRGMNTQTGKNKTTAKFQFSISNQPKLIQVTLTNPTKKTGKCHGKRDGQRTDTLLPYSSMVWFHPIRRICKNCQLKILRDNAPCASSVAFNLRFQRFRRFKNCAKLLTYSEPGQS